MTTLQSITKTATRYLTHIVNGLAVVGGVFILAYGGLLIGDALNEHIVAIGIQTPGQALGVVLAVTNIFGFAAIVGWLRG